MSGWRRITPVAEQGASNKMRSKACLFHQLSRSPASAIFSSALSFSLDRFSSTLGIRRDSESSAKTEPRLGSISRIWQVLPPGAEQASNMDRPGFKDSSPAASCAASSCTLTSPSEKPGRAETSTGEARTTPSSLCIVLTAGIPASSRRCI